MDKQVLNFRKVHFVTSAPDIRHLPNDGGVEIAFAGRSNAGKSSALNTLTQQKNLARTSKTPGRTQLINLFELEPGKRLVDLPGYGYAQVPLEMKIKWQKNLAEYLQRRESLKGLVILMDIRHPLKETDQNMLEWSAHRKLPVLLLLTKADKLNPGPRKTQLLKVRKDVAPLGDHIRVEAFSSLNNLGVDTLAEVLTGWYLDEQPDDEQVELAAE
ncbi:ribosome biogenesis GTP-binding protein YihA/YsxC [Aeromonas simiae]|uniref:Probable GTP-binding protein EngB n=1 Tax=Aeromonas simiae TaxID=218936 RepID=A0A5J6WQL1_9GAMM|nr:ribosome biogenesis GTP-binding protein YihA/YsxC [Aeromonas simiae]MDO2948712.1 ribosome biogenesis GTP-binding protein YihA/YsxC [Aeromonas simiae]MDO2952187.1 ribosome biogenesis GTP-binding protein YihA/YsxC [Aeromonas simiae]MDO2956095.1 ribosome biogenesis GTP-binding protein YihA/YsxC [Aeromonas simiae]QFI53366.1 YihA family ribosome biogenesis GTP-binding protein [Aeromonas simiae]